MYQLLAATILGALVGGYIAFWVANHRQLRWHAAHRPAPSSEPADPETDRVAAQLSAQHLTGQCVEDDGIISLELWDGETAIEISHEVGDKEQAARALDGVAATMRYHAEQIRRAARREAAWT